VLNGHISKGIYSGWYCPIQESFVTSKPATPVDWVEEQNYFLKLAPMEDFIKRKAGKYNLEVLAELA
jgi:methionyl-tRNA synthetase